MILPETKFIEELVTDFCSKFNLGQPPAKVAVWDAEQYKRETGDPELLTCFNPEGDEIALSPNIFGMPRFILHELCHHFQVIRYGAQEFNRKYDEYLETYSYEKHPYELEAEEFEKKWRADFATLIRQKLGG